MNPCNVLITGGEQGLGLAIYDRLADAGHCMHNIPGREIRQAIEDDVLYEFLKGFVDDVLFNKYDLNPVTSGIRISAIINNYGINHLSWIGDTPKEDEQIILANLMVPYWVVNFVREHGCVCRVVNVASQVYRVAQRCTSLYCASKAGLVQMTKVMARELAPFGWVINAVAPGKIEGTRMTELTDSQVLEIRGWKEEDAIRYALKNIPMGRFTDIAEIADLVVKVLDLPDYVNGTVIDSSGGQ